MSVSETSICNLALSHLGQTKRISALSERSAEAEICRIFFDLTRDKVLGDASWPFATKIAELVLVEEEPNDEWGYSYTYPPDCLYARKILSGVRNDTDDTAIPYKIGQDLIFTDQEDAQLEYTMLVSDVSKYSADFVLALSYLLAGYIAPAITSGDPFKLRNTTFQLYQAHIRDAKAAAFNEERPDRRAESEFVRCRE